MTMPHPTILTYDPATGRALIAHGKHLSAWMTVDDLYDQAFAWFDLARELRGRGLAVEAVEATPNQALRAVWCNDDQPHIGHAHYDPSYEYCGGVR